MITEYMPQFPKNQGQNIWGGYIGVKNFDFKRVLIILAAALLLRYILKHA